MFVTLGQITQAQQAATSPWSDRADAMVALVGTKQWAQVVVAATDLAAKATKARAVPVAIMAAKVGEAAKALAGGADKAGELDVALRTLVAVSVREDDSTAPDRIRNEELLDRRMDEFERNYGEWQKAHSGFMAIWDRLRGGADLTPFKSMLEDVKGKIDLAPLTAEGRQRLVERHARLVAGLQPGDWKILVATGVGALVLNLIISNAGTVAASGAAVVYKKHRAKKTEKSKKPRKPRKRKKRSEDD